MSGYAWEDDMVVMGERPDVDVVVELVASDAAPARDTLAWYRLACFLPAALPASANTSPDDDDRAAAVQDYAYVRAQLGACPRTRR